MGRDVKEQLKGNPVFTPFEYFGTVARVPMKRRRPVLQLHPSFVSGNVMQKRNAGEPLETLEALLPEYQSGDLDFWPNE